jgi:hypothetical protein
LTVDVDEGYHLPPLETWPSGRRHAPAKGASGQNLDPGFESLLLRQVTKHYNNQWVVCCDV